MVLHFYLQKELERAKQEQEFVTTEKQNLEKRLKEQTSDNSDLKTSFSDLEVSQLKAEIEVSPLLRHLIFSKYTSTEVIAL